MSSRVPSQIRIAPIEPARDAPLAERVHAIQIAAYRWEADLIGNDAIPPLHETVDDLRRRPFTWLGALDAGQIVGAIAWQETAEIIDIHRLIVDPASHRRGAGTALVRAVLARAGARPVYVATGAANGPARRLYKRLGFVLTGERDIIPGLRIAEFISTPQSRE